MAAPWFEPNTFGSLYGAIAGSSIGILGGCIGAAGSFWVPRGRHRGLVLGAMYVVAMLGIIQLAIGIVALAAGQPYGIYYPLLLCGVISSAVIGGMIPVVRMRYAQAEQRRIDAEGIRRG